MPVPLPNATGLPRRSHVHSDRPVLCGPPTAGPSQAFARPAARACGPCSWSQTVPPEKPGVPNSVPHRNFRPRRRRDPLHAGSIRRVPPKPGGQWFRPIPPLGVTTTPPLAINERLRPHTPRSYGSSRSPRWAPTTPHHAHWYICPGQPLYDPPVETPVQPGVVFETQQRRGVEQLGSSLGS